MRRKRPVEEGHVASAFRRKIPVSAFRRKIPVSAFRRKNSVSAFRRKIPVSAFRRNNSRDQGIALVQVLLLLVLLSAAAGGAALLARVEVLTAQHQRGERDAAYAAEAMLAATLHELDVRPDWNAALAGAAPAGFADGPPAGLKQIPGGGTVDLCCGAGSLTARARADTGEPWVPLAWQSLRGLLNVPEAPPYYLVAWIQDDGEEVDGDPGADTNDRVMIRAEAVTPLGSRKAIEALAERAPLDPVSGLRLPGLRLLTIAERR